MIGYCLSHWEATNSQRLLAIAMNCSHKNASQLKTQLRCNYRKRSWKTRETYQVQRSGGQHNYLSERCGYDSCQYGNYSTKDMMRAAVITWLLSVPTWPDIANGLWTTTSTWETFLNLLKVVFRYLSPKNDISSHPNSYFWEYVGCTHNSFKHPQFSSQNTTKVETRMRHQNLLFLWYNTDFSLLLIFNRDNILIQTNMRELVWTPH